MPARSSILHKEDIFKLTCDKLRKECKKKRISTAGKKSELQSRLVEFLQAHGDPEQNETIAAEVEEEHQQDCEDEPMETNESETPANRTFTVEEESEPVHVSGRDKTPTTSVGLVLDEAKLELCATMGIDLQNFEVKSRPRANRLSSRPSLRAGAATPSRENVSNGPQEANENRAATPLRQIPVSSAKERFALIHARQMEEEESLGERQERLQKRHDDLTGNVPDHIKRLATPKSIKKRETLSRSGTRSAANSASRNWKPQNPSKMTFKFGDSDANDFEAVASSRMETGESSSTPNPSTNKKLKSRARAHIDVKQLTRIPGPSRNAVTPRASRRVISAATIADDDTFTDYISTPKGVTPAKTPKRGGYTPHTKKKVFVDTTQLTDREYNLACEEGLIPGKSATKSNLEKRQLESKKRRDDIIALKRKMNIK